VFLFHHGNPHAAKPATFPLFRFYRDSGNSVVMTSTQSRLGALETRSIDYVPLAERHGKIWHLGPLWFMSNAQIATLAVGLISISEGASLFWSVLAIVVGGFAAMIPFFDAGTLFEGAAAKALGGADISFFIGLPVAGVLYYLFTRSVDVAAETRVAEAEAAELEEAARRHE